MRTTISCTREYLEAMVDLAKRCNRNPIGGYCCLEEFILRNGFEMGDPVNARVKHGQMGYCYANASRLAMSGQGYTYCEGYACGVIPVMHAWCLNADNKVVDPTWKDGSSYFGIAISNRYLCRALLKQKIFGLVDAWSLRWPMLREKPEEWRADIVERIR